MGKKLPKSTLTVLEKSVVKALVNAGWRNQDVQALINTGRPASINFGRISGIKSNDSISPATAEEVDAFLHKKRIFDHITGLCPIDDERLVRAREAMLLAVQLFNTPRLFFKAGVFSMLVNVAWTYLLHQYYDEKGVAVVGKDGRSLLLSQMIKRPDCPLSTACQKNLSALIQIRNVVEHLTVGPFDKHWVPLFQASCLNFEKYLTEWFGDKVSLGNELGFALQFARLKTDEIAVLQGYQVPDHIAALDANLEKDLTPEEAASVEYQFRVVYTLSGTSKSKAHFQFVHPDTAEGAEIRNVLIKYQKAENLWPLKAAKVVELVAEKLASQNRKFTSDKHQRAWNFYKIRPKIDAKNPDETDKRFCEYHALYQSYTYSYQWVDFLVEKLSQDAEWAAVSTYRE